MYGYRFYAMVKKIWIHFPMGLLGAINNQLGLFLLTAISVHLENSTQRDNWIPCFSTCEATVLYQVNKPQALMPLAANSPIPDDLGRTGWRCC